MVVIMSLTSMAVGALLKENILSLKSLNTGIVRRLEQKD
jgi:hypothetical protein